MIIKLTLQQVQFLKSTSTKVYDEKNTFYHIPFWFKKLKNNLFEVVDKPFDDNNEDIKHLEWMYERMKSVHNENENYDYMVKFREILDNLRKN